MYNSDPMLDRLFQLEEAVYSEEDAEWDAFVAAHPHGSILQTTNWARLKSRFGWSPERVWLRRDGRLVAGAQLLIRAAALGIVRVAYVPHGPLVDWQDEEQVAIMVNQIDLAAYRHRAGLLKIEPMLWQREMAPAAWAGVCADQGFVAGSDTIQPPRTIVVDLRPSLDDILARMKQKTRYNIRLAQKKGVTVREGTAEDMRTFNRLMHQTGDRNRFGVHSSDYYRAAYQLFAPQNATLLLAEFEGRALAAVMIFAVGSKAAYLYGVSSNEERQLMPTYAVQWAAMRWAKERGCTEYDMWGIPDLPEEELEAQFETRDDGLWGVYRFKRGFGGEARRTVGTADRVYNNLVYRLYKWMRRR
jgi:peptidoglycan pentaglycine glycine transferase (the first glycine)